VSEAKYDVIVIGSGPGGEGAAMKAAKAGKTVAVVDYFSQVGGACTHLGTIPSKAIRYAIQCLTEFKSNPLYLSISENFELRFPDLVKTAETVIRKQVSMRHAFYERNKIAIYHGRAAFVDPHAIAVTQANGATEHLQAGSFIIATGSRPYRPSDVDFSHPRIFDSDTLLKMESTPKNIAIYGAGTVGCEYASMFRNLGVKVNLVNTRAQLLSFLDDEICDALSYHLRDQGVLIRHNEECEKVEPQDDGVILHLKSGKRLKTDVLLWANGRAGNSQGIGLEKISVSTNERGHIQVNDHYQTAHPHIYAVGDVVGWPSLASAAYDQGRFAATHASQGSSDLRLVRDIPTGIYTSPEISSLGRTERELTESKIPYEVGHSLFRSLARAQITGQTVGMLKILFHRDTLEILGIHCFGDQAAEIIHIGQAIMRQPCPANSLKYFINTTFNYPTMAEAYRVAALNGLNRLF
jgi:NAD(P) transhydrogenase